jgi:hypothetical protein
VCGQARSVTSGLERWQSRRYPWLRLAQMWCFYHLSWRVRRWVRFLGKGFLTVGQRRDPPRAERPFGWDKVGKRGALMYISEPLLRWVNGKGWGTLFHPPFPYSRLAKGGHLGTVPPYKEWFQKYWKFRRADETSRKLVLSR